MKTNWDYILKEDEYSRVIFRVYPKQTNIHSFGENPPKDWKDVYKVYYTWGIIRQEWYDENVESERLFYIFHDECSRVSELHHIIRDIIKTQTEYVLPGFGQPSSDWEFQIHKGVYEWNDNKPFEYYNFQVFDNYYDNGFRFTLDRKQTEDFADWLEKMNDRALVKCGCSI